MIGYGIIVPLEKVVEAVARKVGKNSRDFLFDEFFNSEESLKINGPLSEERIKEFNKDPVNFWYREYGDLDDIISGDRIVEIHIIYVGREIRNVFIGETKDLGKRVISMDKFERGFNKAYIHNELQKQGFDDQRCKIYILGGVVYEFEMNDENETASKLT